MSDYTRIIDDLLNDLDADAEAGLNTDAVTDALAEHLRGMARTADRETRRVSFRTFGPGDTIDVSDDQWNLDDDNLHVERNQQKVVTATQRVVEVDGVCAFCAITGLPLAEVDIRICADCGRCCAPQVCRYLETECGQLLCLCPQDYAYRATQFNTWIQHDQQRRRA